MSKTDFLQKMFEKGAYDALCLRTEAVEGKLTQTEIIAREVSIPAFDPQKDYTNCPINSPIADEGQVWLLLQPYNAAHYEGRPSELRAMWGLAHTKDASKAKAYVAPFGISGLYMIDECCVWADKKVYKSTIDNNAYSPEEYPAGWSEVI